MVQPSRSSLLIAVLASCAAHESLVAAPPSRVARDLVVLYTFDHQKQDVIRDQSKTGKPLDLAIDQRGRAEQADGRLTIRSSTRFTTSRPAAKIIDACKESQEITVEAWVKPANVQQSGPARIVSLSRDTTNRNFTLGQDGDHYDVRLRTTSTSANGLPSTATPSRSAKNEWMHLVFTRERTGTARVFINGKKQAEKKLGGTFASWDSGYRLTLGNELGGDRPWLGEMNLVAIYSRALTPGDVSRNYSAGAAATLSPAALAQRQRDASEQHFAHRVAPLLARRCLECHDSATKEGGLDLSRKSAALAGGESGKVLVAGKAAASPLWTLVAKDEMPHERPPLSTEEKRILREWVEGPAVWSLDVIDPAVYVLKNKSNHVWVQRLTVDEYIETVQSATGVDISRDARRLLPRDLRADGFSNTAYNLNVDLKHVAAYAALAQSIVSQLDVDAFTGRFSRNRQLTKANRDLIAKMGKWLLRGPLGDEEIAAYRGVATTVASAGGDFREAMRYVIEAMLQSPRFIYRIESQRGGGTRVDPYELASRMSYIVWGGPPDQALFGAADSGKLNRTSVAAHIDRMLKDPRAKRRALQFATEWLNLARLDNLRPNPMRFPRFQTELARDMRLETLKYFEEIAWNQDRPLADLLNAQTTFVTPRLARHYGLKLAPSAAEDTPTAYDLRSRPERGGLLTHASLLTVGGDEASMVSRGLFVLNDLLRGVVKDPPPCVDTTPVPTRAGLTQRAIAAERIASAKCGGCHARFEPLAFGLEKFDGLGAFHEKDEHGNRLRDDGQILVPGTAKPRPYASSAELMDLLAKSDRVRETIAWKLTQFALGRPLGATDAAAMASIHKTSQNAGGTYRSLLKAIILSELVQTQRPQLKPVE